jgi:hypothetical protein
MIALSDVLQLIEHCRTITEEPCYCCEVWPINDDGGECENCHALKQATDMLEQLIASVEHTADGKFMRSEDTVWHPGHGECNVSYMAWVKHPTYINDIVAVWVKDCYSFQPKHEERDKK